ncbi:MAG: S41 family peptidase [Candidatus Shapirobacteria bacterium]|nr:S41 family peptidase [Candidatus Shapirobacteria bacterium]MDD5481638.1 S41 family peptidase [Candidatus Shapirobacteria bacterium]
MTIKNFRNLILLLALLVFSFGAGWKLSQNYSQNTNLGSPSLSFTQSSLFGEVYQLLDQLYLNKDQLLDQKKLLYGSVAGMVEALGDPYTVFLPPEDNEKFKEDMAGSFGGVGIELGYKNNQLAVVAPLEGSPAQKIGIRSGDLIAHIKDENKEIDRDSLNLSLAEAVEIIRGPKGSKVTLTLIREGASKPLEVDLVRDEIVVPRVTLEYINHNNQRVAYIRLARFGDNTIEQWDEVIGKIELEKNLAGIILDLRNNPGGYLDGAIYIASEFIDRGVIVHQESASGNRQTFSVNRQGKLLKDPLAIIVNQGSASASEIVAGALKEQRGTPIIGKTTFGKGTIQQSKELPDDSSVHITIAAWLLPSGTQIHQKGIEPNIEVEDNLETEKDEALIAALDQLINP